MATIRKRVGRTGKVTYQVQVRLAGCKPQTKSFAREQKAIDWARQVEGAVQELRARPELAHTLQDAIERYVRTVVPRHTPTTQRTERFLLEFWHNRWGKRALLQITPDDIAKVRDELGLTKSPATVNRHLAKLARVLALAAREWDWIRDNPAARVSHLEEPEGRVRWLEPEEISRLLAACGPRLRPVVVTALATGMRRGEIEKLKWAQVDLARRLIVVEKPKNKKRRGVNIIPALYDELKALPRRVGTDLLFPATKRPDPPADQPGKVLDFLPWDFRKAFELAVERAGLSDFRFHDLRHTAASYLAMNGATDLEIAAVLGHRTLDMVKRYAHLSQGHLAALMARAAGSMPLGLVTTADQTESEGQAGR